MYVFLMCFEIFSHLLICSPNACDSQICAMLNQQVLPPRLHINRKLDWKQRDRD